MVFNEGTKYEENRDSDFALLLSNVNLPNYGEQVQLGEGVAHNMASAVPSLDFDRIVNSYSIAATRARNSSKRNSQSLGTSLSESTSHTSDSSASLGRNGGVQQAQKEEGQVITEAGFTATRWMLTFTVGLCTGVTAVVIIFCVEFLIEFRVDRLNSQLQWAMGHAQEEEIEHFYHGVHSFDVAAREFGLPGVYAGYAIYNVILVLISTALCVFWEPGAVGSGIPEVKAYLNGVRVDVFDSIHLYWIKLLGTIFSVSSGLVVGPEGPVVHLGAVIGSLMTKTGDLEWRVREFQKRHPNASMVLGCADRRRIDVLEVSQTDKDNAPKTKHSFQGNGIISSFFFYLSHFRNDLERRHLISIGAAAGFASAFGAPVGGLLYSMEEASSFFAHDMLWKTLFGTAVATCCIAMYHGDFTRYCMLSLEIGVQEESLLARFGEVPLYIVMGACGGLLGALFNNTFAFVNKKRDSFYSSIAMRKGTYAACKLLESAAISVLTSVLMLTVPLVANWACRDIDASGESFDTGFLHRYNCPPGQINEIGSILFGSREESIKDILTSPAEFQPATLLSVGVIFLALMMVTFGIALPSGMFMPTVLTGASLGGYAGLQFQTYFVPSVHPSDFAIIGAAAFLAGMQRNTVSLCVILMEGTGQTKVIIPVIITVVCARMVGDLLSEGIYEVGMELKEFPYLNHETRARYDMFCASHVMSKPAACVGTIETAADVESLLVASDYNAFPVVDRDTRQYKGMVRRDQLVAALQCKIYMKSNNRRGAENEVTNVVHSRVLFDSDTTGVVKRPSLRRISDDVYTSHRNLRLPEPDWTPIEPVVISPWLRDNVLTSQDGDEILFGMDETLPIGMIKTNTQAVVGVIDKKLIVYVSPKDKDKHLNVEYLMNRAALSVLSDFPLSKTYDLFISMGLRHMPVLGKGGRVVGMITRHNLSDDFVAEKIGYNLY